MPTRRRPFDGGMYAERRHENRWHEVFVRQILPDGRCLIRHWTGETEDVVRAADLVITDGVGRSYKLRRPNGVTTFYDSRESAEGIYLTVTIHSD